MVDQWLKEGTEAHYRDGAYYDHRYRGRRHDVAHYVELSRRSGGPVLELGVGTGRVAVAIAAAGFDVVGLDRMPPMLERARIRLAKAPRRIRERVTLVEGDLLSARLGRDFPLVIAPFNVFMHLYTRAEVEAALATARAHLRGGGLLAFDVLLPDVRALSRDPTRLYRCRPIRHPRDGKQYGYREAFHYDSVTQVQLVSTLLERLDAPEVAAEMTQLSHRQFFPQELEALLHYNGFDIAELAGNFDGDPLTPMSESQVIVARVRKQAP